MKKILVIDDEPQILLMVSARLKANGYDVFTAFSGEQGLKRAKKEIPDLILLDHVMPEMDGDEVLKRLKKDAVTKSIPVVMFTANIKRVKVGEYQARGAVDCIYKPFLPEELLAMVKKVLDKKL
ncbi:MAG: response regulator [Candidatus Omnitrophica bacterium]|nr:response regulator [Candidatus Omnitrophota bacterium]